LGVVANGISSFLQQKQLSDAQKVQAQALQDSINAIQNELNKNAISEREALERLHTLYSTLKPKLREIMNARIDDAMKQLQQEYKTTMQNIRTQYTQRRLPVGAIANQMFGKEAERMGNITAEANRRQQELEAGLASEEYAQGENIRDKYKQYYDNLFANLQQLKASKAGVSAPIVSPAVMGITGALTKVPEAITTIWPGEKGTSKEKELPEKK